ncbi:MAG: AAA family ATPase, partial [Peptococcaceae bacterium]|nr:AAA family ATPase [Peptococcaceae bacterium]
MDIGTTISAVRREYKEYLHAQHPEWVENSVKTHVSDAFYLWNNTIVPSFWKSLYDDDSMEEAKNAIYDYLKNEVQSDNAEVRAKSYFKDLTMLKEFLDSKFGGVKNRVGYEYDCEKTIYYYAKLVYEGEMTTEQAVITLVEEVPCFSDTTHKLMVMLFGSMINGQKYTRRANTETTLYFISQMGVDYGVESMTMALKATQENIQYYYEQTGNKSNSMCRGCKKIAEKHGISINFDELIFNGIIPKQIAPDEVLAGRGVRYWIYSPYDQWEEQYKNGIITIGRDYIGDPALYATKQEMQRAMQDCGTETYTTTYKNAALEVWQFIHEIKPGDIIIAKRGLKSVIGRGVVTSEFIYDATKPTDYKYYRHIEWTHKGQWNHPGNAVTKTLTDITPYKEYVKELNALFEDVVEPELSLPSYTAEDFLQDVYMDETNYNMLKVLLLTKKNVILQGAPGVGKTFAAKRLAFSIMGEKDNDRVKMVQFHQSYSYEDFIMGYRPSENGFYLKKGVFYEFCRKAAEDDK